MGTTAIQHINVTPVEDPLPYERDSKRAKNWAVDARVVERIKNELVPLLTDVRTRRQPLTDMWNRLFKVWSLEHPVRMYVGTSNLYIPAGKKALETLVSNLVAGTFPGDDNFGISARKQENAGLANDVKEILRYRIDHSASVRTAAEVYYRQLVTTGNSPVKLHYQKKVLNTRKRSRKVDELAMPVNEDEVLFEGQRFDPVDVGNFFVWPENVNRMEDCEVVFEDLSVSLGELHRRSRQGVYDQSAVEAAGKGLGDSGHGRRRTSDNKLQAQGLAGHEQGKVTGFSSVDITEVWLDFDPKANSREEEENPVPFFITVTSSGEVLRAIENPFWHKQPPYRMGRMGTVVGRVYGTGIAEGIEQLQVLLNDQTNQAMDCATYALNPIVLTNPNGILGTLPEMEPGVQFLVNDINNAVKFDRPPADLIQVGGILTAQTASMIQDYSNSPAVLSGGSAPGRAFKTATGIGAAQRNATVPLQEIIRLSEKEVFQPMLRMFWSLEEQFGDPTLPFNLLGVQKVTKTIRDLVGDWDFEWLASTQTTNQQVKSGQLMEFLSLIMNPQLVQMLQQKQVDVNPVPILSRLYTEGFGFRDIDRVLMPMQAMQPPGMPGQPPGMPPEMQGGMPPEMAPGTGAGPEMDLPEELMNNPDFIAARQSADMIAAGEGADNAPDLT